MKIAFIYNVRYHKPSMKNEQSMVEAEYDEISTINGIYRALLDLGHRVIKIEANENAYFKLKKSRKKIDLVFNIAEGLGGDDREAQIPSILEMLRIPYVGSKPLTQALCLNKAFSKQILQNSGIPTPNFQLIGSSGEQIRKELKFPVIVKPNKEGSSKGILQSSFVKRKANLNKIAGGIIKKYGQSALAEEYLDGREFTVALLGNEPCEVLPIIEIDFSSLPKKYLPIDSYEVKWIIDSPESKTETVVCPARIAPGLKRKIEQVCLEAKEALSINDFCRIDVRLDQKGVPNIIDINQIPGIIPDPKQNSRFPLAARTAGYSYGQMLNKIIKSALGRYKKYAGKNK